MNKKSKTEGRPKKKSLMWSLCNFFIIFIMKGNKRAEVKFPLSNYHLIKITSSNIWACKKIRQKIFRSVGGGFKLHISKLCFFVYILYNIYFHR